MHLHVSIRVADAEVLLYLAEDGEDPETIEAVARVRAAIANLLPDKGD
jgi:hypothetical protein